MPFGLLPGKAAEAETAEGRTGPMGAVPCGTDL